MNMRRTVKRRHIDIAGTEIGKPPMRSGSDGFPNGLRLLVYFLEHIVRETAAPCGVAVPCDGLHFLFDRRTVRPIKPHPVRKEHRYLIFIQSDIAVGMLQKRRDIPLFGKRKCVILPDPARFLRASA